MSTASQPSSANSRPTVKTIASLAVRYLAVLALLAVLLFVPGGRWNWADAWIYVGGYGLFLALYGVWGLWKDPAQLNERSRTAPNVKPWDRLILAAYTLCLLLIFPLAGLDAGRFQWTAVSPPLKAVGWLGLIAAGAIIFWSLATNTYLSRNARIQDDRGQVVVSSGPYRHVRHPMYTGIIVLFLCTPLALGSWWALIPGAVIAGLFILRTAKEDRMLSEELAGYAPYTREVRYRLLPGVW